MVMAFGRFYGHWDLLVEEGKVAGYQQRHRIGENLDVDATTVPEDIWPSGGLYTGFPTTDGEQLQITSSDAADSAAGTGIRTIEIEGLDVNWRQVRETVILDGVSPSLTVEKFVRVNSVTGITCGSAEGAVGIITVRHNVTTANVFATIAIGDGGERNATFSVPLEKKGFIRRIKLEVAGVPGVTGTVDLLSRQYGGPWISLRKFIINATSFYDDLIVGGLEVGEKTDLVLRVNSVENQNNTAFVGGFSLTLTGYSSVEHF
jgi:hypothetical protein